jgi:cytochrome c-type biogenesis protein CcsB
MPALLSAWRVPHIFTAILAYASFGIAFTLAIMYLIREGIDTDSAGKNDKSDKSFWASRLPSAEVLDQTIYRTIAFGFLMQTLLVVVGAIWAQFAWGRYWGWDPKETWSLITWLIYADLPAHADDAGLEGKEIGVACHNRLWGDNLHPARRKLYIPRVTQLCFQVDRTDGGC